MGVELNFEHGYPEYEQAERRRLPERVDQALEQRGELDHELDEFWLDLADSEPSP